MNSQGIFAIGLILIVSINVSSAQIVKHTNVTAGVRKGGDRMLGTKTESFTFPTFQNVKKLVTFDTTGPKITQITFDVETNSNFDVIGKVVSGGIGQKQIGVELNAQGVSAFKYTVFVYGSSAAVMPSLGLIASFVAYIIFVNKH